MSLRTSRVYLSFFLLLALVSCEKPTDIGLDLPGQNQLGTHFATQPALAATVIQSDSILAFKNEPIVVGKVTDGLLGTIASTHYTEIGLNGTNVRFDIPAGGQADSMVLVLAYYSNLNVQGKPGYYYGDTTTTIKLNVLKLTENFKDDRSYFINSSLTTDATPLGSITFKPTRNRAKKDISRTLHIPLDINLANDLLTRTFATQDEFRNFWKGIAITPDAGSNAGSLVGLTTLPDSAGTLQGRVAGINLYYKDKAGKQQKHNFSFSGTQYFNGLEINRQGQLATLDKPNKELASAQTNNLTFVQENTGVKTRLTFPGLENFKTDKGNIFVNYAELIIPVKPNTFNAKNPVTPLPSTIFLYENNANFRIPRTTGGTAIAVQAGNAPAFNITNPAIGRYNSDSLYYSVNITSYVQAVIDKQKANSGIIVTPTPEDRASASAASLAYPGTLSLRRALIDAADKKIGLRIYYSELK